MINPHARFNHQRHVRIFTNKRNSKSIAFNFAKEFGYENMSYTCEDNNKAIVIEEGSNEIIYELENYSKDYKTQSFTIEYFSPKTKEIQKSITIELGKVKNIKTFDKSNQKHINKKSNQHKQNKNHKVSTLKSKDKNNQKPSNKLVIVKHKKENQNNTIKFK